MTADCIIKFIVLGESGVGKTSLLLKFAQKNDLLKPTLIIDRLNTNITVQNKEVHLELWDTVGQERFRSIVRKYFRNADGVLLVYDVTNMESFLKLSSWLLDLKTENSTAVSIIVGNKIDDPNRNAVCINQVKRFAEEENLEFYESSAKTGEHVDEIFKRLTLKVLKAKKIISTLQSSSSSGQLQSLEDSIAHTAHDLEQLESSGESTLSTYSVIPDQDSITLQDNTVPVKKKKNC